MRKMYETCRRRAKCPPHKACPVARNCSVVTSARAPFPLFPFVRPIPAAVPLPVCSDPSTSGACIEHCLGIAFPMKAGAQGARNHVVTRMALVSLSMPPHNLHPCFASSARFGATPLSRGLFAYSMLKIVPGAACSIAGGAFSCGPESVRWKSGRDMIAPRSPA